MALSICPKCSQVTLSIGDDTEIKCPICETTYQIETGDSSGE